jgi:hypothetical protein
MSFLAPRPGLTTDEGVLNVLSVERAAFPFALIQSFV